MDGALAGAVSHLRNRAGDQVSGAMANDCKTGGCQCGRGKYLTAALLAVFALGLFLFTLYSGLN